MSNEPSPQREFVPARFLPRDLLDVAIGLPIGLIYGSAIVGLPAAGAFLVSGSEVWVIAATLLAVGLYSSYGVRSLELSPDGIRFRRLLGTPKHLPWDQVVSILPAERKEVVLRGWLRPLMPRDMTACLSARGHYRITWGKQWCYFPPKDSRGFIEVIQKYSPQAVSQATDPD